MENPSSMRRLALLLVIGSMLPISSVGTARSCGGLDAGVPTPVGVTQCYDLRPGSPVTGCTLNFLFAGSDGRRYMGTAGHCIVAGGTIDRVFTSPGPVARSRGLRIGEFAYAVFGAGRDFALIRLDDGIDVSPELAHFGGPTALYTEHEQERVILHHYGHGIGAGATVPARSGFAFGTSSESHVYSVSAGVFGDSGSGVIDSKGRAVGVLVTLGAHEGGTNGITRIDYQLPFAEDALGITLQLETAPLRALA